MEALQGSSAVLDPTPSAAPSSNSFAQMGAGDFLGLLITQLTHQDPLEPTGNEELLQQMASIREIELSTSLAESLQALTGQQHFAGASALIGRHVTGPLSADGSTVSGVVVGVQFGADGQAVLKLAGGGNLPMAEVTQIASEQQAAEALLGQAITGLDRRDASDPRLLDGVVTSVKTDDLGRVLLELDTGEDLPFRDVLTVSALNA